MKSIDVEHLSDLCMVVACGWTDQIRELIDRVERRRSTDQPISSLDIRSLLPVTVLPGTPRRFVDAVRFGSLPQAMQFADFNRSFVPVLDHYLNVPYHAVYVDFDVVPTTSKEKAGRTTKGKTFSAQFFTALDEIASHTLDIYFHVGDLVTQALPVDKYEDRKSDSWLDVVRRADIKVAAELVRQQETSLVVWDRHFRLAVLPLGRFNNEARVSSIATLVAALEGGAALSTACRLATENPLGRVGSLVSNRLDQLTLETRHAWITELDARHFQHPDRGYDEVARILRQEYSPSLYARMYGSTRVRLAIVIATGLLVGVEHAENLVQLPEAWATLVGWFGF